MQKSNINAKLKKNPKAKSNYFTGKVVAKDVSAIIKPEEEKIYHVTFQNGARTKLHYHNAGQTLIITKGTGSLALYKKSAHGYRGRVFSITVTVLTRDQLDAALWRKMPDGFFSLKYCILRSL